MFIISENQQITINRGDCFDFTVFINQGTEETPIRYILSGNDTVHFTVYQTNWSSRAISTDERTSAMIHKTATSANLDTDGDAQIFFVENDTKSILPNEYYYDVKVVLADGTVNTIIPRTKFTIVA